MNGKDKEIIDILDLIKKINELINDGETTSVVCPCCGSAGENSKREVLKEYTF